MKLAYLDNPCLDMDRASKLLHENNEMDGVGLWESSYKTEAHSMVPQLWFELCIGFLQAFSWRLEKGRKPCFSRLLVPYGTGLRDWP